MTDELRTTLHRIADDVRPEPVADDLWQRGRAARRRGQDLALAAVLLLVVSVAGAGAWALDDREAQVTDSSLRGGAIPSQIEVPSGPFEEDYAIGRASVAFSDNYLIVIGAGDGRYHHFAVPADVVALSPDGLRLAWWSSESLSPDRISIADPESGDVLQFAHNIGRGAQVTSLLRHPDSINLVWDGRDDDGPATGIIDVTGPSESPYRRPESLGILSPMKDAFAMSSRQVGPDAPFLVESTSATGGRSSERLGRPLPIDLYPDGALVRPVGWAEENLVVAVIDPPPSDVVERPRLAIFTSPDRPESEWIYREFLPRLPPVESLSIAVDLIPDLTGETAQELTRDFDAAPSSEERDISWMIGLGVAAAIAVLLALQQLWRRVRP